MTLQETTHLVALIAATYPRWNPADETPSAWHRALHDLDAGMALEALDDCVKVSEWEPTPASIREAYAHVRSRRRAATPRLPEPEISPEEAAENRRLIREYAERIGVGGESGMAGMGPTMAALPVSESIRPKI